jgi:protoporphyrinogen oxidase
MQPIVLEAGDDVGGISRTVEYKGNRMDIGGHRFFSKSDWVMDWWREILPIAADQPEARIRLSRPGSNSRRRRHGDSGRWPRPCWCANASRASISCASISTTRSRSTHDAGNLGPRALARIGASYLRALLFPRRPERTLEDFLVNRFGAELYRTFFKDYTEKVWGVPCREITAEWGAQRIKGLSVREALRHACAADARKKERDAARNTSLIEQLPLPAPRAGPDVAGSRAPHGRRRRRAAASACA